MNPRWGEIVKRSTPRDLDLSPDVGRSALQVVESVTGTAEKVEVVGSSPPYGVGAASSRSATCTRSLCPWPCSHRCSGVAPAAGTCRSITLPK